MLSYPLTRSSNLLLGTSGLAPHVPRTPYTSHSPHAPYASHVSHMKISYDHKVPRSITLKQ